MLYTIENKSLIAKISDVGAELKSLKSLNDGFEYIWKGDAKYWKNSATILFPVCGRLYEKKYLYDGKEYEMNIHGFARDNVFSVKEHCKDKIVFELNYSQSTLKIYPFKFTLLLTYELIDNNLLTRFTVINKGSDILPFSVGGHPGFSLPLEDGLDFIDHYLEFDKAEKRTQILFSKNGLYLEQNSDIELEDDKILRLKPSIFKTDGVFFNTESGSLTLKSDKTDRWVKVSYKDITHLGVWQPYSENTPFICIEPWHGIPGIEGKTESFENKTEFIRIKENAEYNFEFNITVNK